MMVLGGIIVSVFIFIDARKAKAYNEPEKQS